MKYAEIVVVASFVCDGFRSGYEMTCRDCTPTEALAQLEAWLAEQRQQYYWPQDKVLSSYRLVVKA